MTHFRIDRDDGVARLTLTRPERHNAFDDRLVEDLARALETLAADRDVRILVLAAEGPSFSAGAELEWMKRAGEAGYDENLADARRLAGLMAALDAFPGTTVAAVQGPAYGGGVGLVACCDIAIASTAAKFALSEVKLGLIPAVIGPYVVAAIGPRQARRYVQTAEIITAETAVAIGLVHEAVAPDMLERRIGEIVDALRKGAPQACREAKRLVRDIAFHPADADTIEMTATRIAELRSRPEAREGLDAFLSRRPASWVPAGETSPRKPSEKSP